jgi:hypothetical protein
VILHFDEVVSKIARRRGRSRPGPCAPQQQKHCAEAFAMYFAKGHGVQLEFVRFRFHTDIFRDLLRHPMAGKKPLHLRCQPRLL